MVLKYDKYPFTSLLGWSISRYETFDTCRRLYYYTYYGKHIKDIPFYKIKDLKALTTVPLEIGNVVHDILEAFLRRLQKSDSDIDEKRFYEFARHKTREYFSTKTFLEIYYGQRESVDAEAAYERVAACLRNFINSPIYSWLFMKAMRNRENWMIEPAGYGETRLNGLKAYCKMDFLFPVDDHVYIIDWKTGRRDDYKHTRQVIGYAAAAGSNFGIPHNVIYPKIVYLHPQFDELELTPSQEDLDNLFRMVSEQTEEMLSFCEDRDRNTPLSIEKFPMNPAEYKCRRCNFQELCFPDRDKPAPSFD